MTIDVSDEDPVIKATGLAFAVLAKLLEAKKVLYPGELGEQLALLATVSSETDDEVGGILALWSMMASASKDPAPESPQH